MKKGTTIALLLAGLSVALAQTKLDLGAQSRNVDFSQATSVRPFPTGASLPSTCTVGQFFFLTTAPAGANQCVAINTWASIQGSQSSSSQTTATPAGMITVQLTRSTVLTIGPNCSVQTPCLFRVGSSVYGLTAPATVTSVAGTGLAFIYIDGNGNITVGVASPLSPSVTCSGCLVVTPVTQYPLGMIPIETWNVSNGTWDPTGQSSVATMSVPPAIIGGSNISVTQSAGAVTVSYTGIDGSSSGGAPLSGFNPADQTQFYLDHLALKSGFSRGYDGWDYSGACGNGNPGSTPGFVPETIVAGVWGAAAGAGSTCFFLFPGVLGTGAAGGSYDYWSGTAPANLWVSSTITSVDTNGTLYVGLSNSGNYANDFIGCRQIGAGDWFAVIRAAGVDIAKSDTGYPHDTASHRLTIDNNTGAANTIRCSVDGGSTATATGTIPGESSGWYFVVGSSATGSTPTNFATYQYTIYLQNLPRL